MFNIKKVILIAMVFIMLPAYFTFAGTVELPRTGHNTSLTPGDDGDIQAGVAWPIPRFTDNGDGTITDNLTGLIWLQDAFCFSTRAWEDGLDAISEFNNNPSSFGCVGYTANNSDWHFPNINELQSLINHGNVNSCNSLIIQGFVNIKCAPNIYWTSTTFSADVSKAWYVSLLDLGLGAVAAKFGGAIIWPVRNAQ